MSALLGFPVLLLALILQSAIAGRLPLLQGTADLVLLTLLAWGLQERVQTTWIWALIAGFSVSLVSAMPLYLPVFFYLIAAGIARLLQRRVWQMPILALYVAVVLATLIQNGLSIIVLQFFDHPISWSEGIGLVALPSLLLNLLLALPVYTVIADMANWVYPPVEA